MASISSSVALSAVLSVWIFLASPARSMKCQSQKFQNDQVFDNCEDLPELKAFLHYTYDKSNNSLAFAYTAPPPKPDGWVAWGINPTKEGMVGTQAIMGVKDKGAVTVKTFDLSGYTGVREGKLTINVWDLSAEEGKGVISVFGKLKLPGKDSTVNHVWQVGPGMVQGIGVPQKHEMQDENLNSKGKLQLKGGKGGHGDSATTSPVSAPTATPKTETEAEKALPDIEIKIPPSPPTEAGAATRLSEVGFYIASSAMLVGSIFLF